jgi:hypothetical protein
VWFTIRAPSCLKGLPVVVRSKSGVVERTGIPGESGPTGKLERGGHVDGKDPNRLLCLGGEPVSLEEVCPDLGPQCNKALLWDIVGSLSCPAKPIRSRMGVDLSVGPVVRSGLWSSNMVRPHDHEPLTHS